MLALPSAHGQGATILGNVVAREGGARLGYTSISIVPQGEQRLSSESGRFLLTVPQGEVRLRFKRIGFAPRDTVLAIASSDTARIRIEMTRLAIRLPAIVVSGKCTNESPLATTAPILAELFDQVHQNAERVKLLAKAEPFLIQVLRVRGIRNRDDGVAATRIDTVLRRPMPVSPYEPRNVLQSGEGVDAGGWVVALPELPDFADSAFTNNHCFRYAGQMRFDSDSVIAVEFEPVPWLDKEVDIKGTMYLRAEDHQLVGLVASLNRIPSQFRPLLEYTVRARFSEIVPGIPILAGWEMTNRFRSPTLPRVEIGQVIDIRWDSPAARPDTTRRPLDQ